MLAMVLVASVTVVTVQRDALSAAIDETLRQRADNLLPIDPSADVLPDEGDVEDSFVQVLDSDGAVVASSANVAGRPAASVQVLAGSGSRLQTTTLGDPSGTYRIYVRAVSVNGLKRSLVVAKNLDDVNQNIHTLVVSLAVISPVLGLLLGALAWWLIGRTLRPVDGIRKEVENIQGDQLHRRVPVPDTHDEISELARTMNAMLARVESAAERQKQFVDDASHELRTPLTRIITDLEVSIAHPDQTSSQVTLQRVLEESKDLEQLLHDLLYLARNPNSQTAHREVDLDDIASSAGQAARSRTTMRVDTTGVAAARVLGDERALDRAISNLLDNSLRHARSQVSIATEVVNGWCLVTIDDDGDGIPVADRARVFERFTRLDEARNRQDGGAGLGLAIVSDIAARHHGAVAIGDAPIGGARLILKIPAYEPNDRAAKSEKVK